MDIIIANRGEGKTTSLIKQSAVTKSIIVCKTSTMCKNVMFEARKMKLSIPEPISFYQFLTNINQNSNTNNHYLIDELSSCLSMIHVDTATLDRSNTKKLYIKQKYKTKIFSGNHYAITADERFNAWQEEQQKQGKDIEIINFKYCQAKCGDHSIAILYKEI